jgi:glutathione peroxidase
MNLYDFKVQNIKGEEVDLSNLKGKKVMVVNTASECGLTPQYEELEKLYKETDQERFEIIGFPANNFGAQEPGTNDEIATFCQSNYGVSFPMMSKISVKGEDRHPLYQWLIEGSREKGQHDEVKWNFHKFLIDESGALVKSVEPTTSPMDNDIISWINGK